MRALLSIDYTKDFVATDGKLTTGEAGQAIEGSWSLSQKTISSRGILSFLLLMGMIQAISTILKINSFRRTMSSVRADESCMAH